MAPGGPWDASPRPERSKRWHGDLFCDILDFWIIFAQKHCVSVLSRDNKGRPADGRRAAGGRANSDPTGVPPRPPKIAIPLLGGKSPVNRATKGEQGNPL